MAGAIVDFDNEITAHRLIRDDVLKTLYGSSSQHIVKLLDTALSLQEQVAQTAGLSNLTEFMGLRRGNIHSTSARTRLEALRHAVLMYSSLCNMDVLDDSEDDEKPIVSDVNKRFMTEVREITTNLHPDFAAHFNKQSPVVEGSSNTVKFGFISEKVIIHFSVLHPIRQSQSVREARAKLWELFGAHKYTKIAPYMIMGVPRIEDDIMLGYQQIEAARLNMDEIETEADKNEIRLLRVKSPYDGAKELIRIST